jgi:hypothetical protein
MAKKPTSTSSAHPGLALAAIAGLAGAYFFYGSKNAPKNRKAVKSWMLKARGEVLEKIEKAKALQAADYESIIDTVAAKYAKLKHVNAVELKDLTTDLKKHWKDINREATKVAKNKR